jgi:hypothetical protein
MNTTNTYDKMQLQRDFMDCWLIVLDDPMPYRVIIELDEEDETNAWTDEDGNKHALNKYIMIEGSNGIKLFDDNKWLISSSWKKDPILVNPEEVLPRALQVIDGGHVKEIYNDVI